jgi:hypothetical protein
MTPMKIVSLVCASALALVPLASLAQTFEFPKPKPYGGYKAPRLSDGRPDLTGVWSNATTTKMERAANLGDRLIMTPEELAQTEKATNERNARQNKITTKEEFESWSKVALQPDNSDECRSGSRGTACGYNAGWTDPGDLVMRVGGQPRTSFITFPANGRIPPRIPGAARQGGAELGEGGAAGNARANDNPETRGLAERCILMSARPVASPGLYNNNYQIVQSKDAVALVVEMINDVRLVRIGGKHRTDGVRPYMGDSIGWYEGDTLVVETINYHPSQNFNGASGELKITERFTRVSPTRLHYAFKVEDPKTWATPWGGEYEFSSVSGRYEYACHEGNYGLENILAGARDEDRAAASRAAGQTAAR